MWEWDEGEGREGRGEREGVGQWSGREESGAPMKILVVHASTETNMCCTNYLLSIIQSRNDAVENKDGEGTENDKSKHKSERANARPLLVGACGTAHFFHAFGQKIEER